jgi:hypothetical protein
VTSATLALGAALVLVATALGAQGRAPLLLDDLSRPGGLSALGTAWRGFTDRVMGGVSPQALAAPLDRRALERVAIAASKRAFQADVALSRLELY